MGHVVRFLPTRVEECANSDRQLAGQVGRPRDEYCGWIWRGLGRGVALGGSALEYLLWGGFFFSISGRSSWEQQCLLGERTLEQ